MQRTPPTPEGLARRLLAYEAGEHQTSEELLRAAERIHLRLRERLTIFLGPHGFDSLWSRAMLLAGHKLPPIELRHGIAPQPVVPVLHAAAVECNPSEVYVVLIEMFASFIALFFTFIGARLGFRLLSQVWPELPLDEADTQTGEASHA